MKESIFKFYAGYAIIAMHHNYSIFPIFIRRDQQTIETNIKTTDFYQNDNFYLFNANKHIYLISFSN